MERLGKFSYLGELRCTWQRMWGEGIRILGQSNVLEETSPIVDRGDPGELELVAAAGTRRTGDE